MRQFLRTTYWLSSNPHLRLHWIAGLKKVKDDFNAWQDKYNAIRRYFATTYWTGPNHKSEDKETNREDLTRIQNFLVMSEEMQRDIWQMNLDRKRKYVWPVDDDAPDDNGVAAIDSGIPVVEEEFEDHEMAIEVEDAEFEDHFMAAASEGTHQDQPG
ncbi:unnamed protein product [Caenorhabditis brenneri]